jgi:predicted transglutaminase-like cysteine proteinase
MAMLAAAARSFLLVGIVCCGPVGPSAHPLESSPGAEAFAGATPGSQAVVVVPATNQKNPNLPRLTLLTPREGAISEPFGGDLLIAPVSDLSAKWAELQVRISSEQETLFACRSDWDNCPPAARRFMAIIELARQREGRARLGEINRAVNLSIKPVSDWELYGVDDFWSAPLATFSIGAGDCEDYAIAKYVAFRESGIAPDDLRLVILHDLKRNTNHAVLAVRQDQEWLILDNRTLVIVNAEEARHYHPLMVLDHRGARAFGTVALLR